MGREREETGPTEQPTSPHYLLVSKSDLPLCTILATALYRSAAIDQITASEVDPSLDIGYSSYDPDNQSLFAVYVSEEEKDLFIGLMARTVIQAGELRAHGMGEDNVINT